MKIEWTAQKVEYPRPMVDLARRRTKFVIGPLVSLDFSLTEALACAYLQGMNDAIDTLQKE